ncbi:MAG TPA: hypothetical protein VHU87_09975 [Rhizomicrobium sp.]|jgi:hypothetical protein|nr:hypothetical protein [Rhizomicrobium sp.]
MMQPAKISRLGFAVVKLLIHGSNFFLMRRSKRWDDISFIGGHENERDSGKLSRSAYRELLEEVPTLRNPMNLKLVELTDSFCYGPIHSQSAEMLVGYELQFFLVEFLDEPLAAIESLGRKSPNLLMRQGDLLGPSKYKMAGLVKLLADVLPNGLEGIPYSWPNDLANSVKPDRVKQLQLDLQLDM